MDKKKFNFALSIPPIPETANQCLKAIKNTPFRMLEIPGTWLESQNLKKDLQNFDFHIIGVTDLMATSVARSIPDQKKNIIKGFINQILILFKEIENCDINTFSLNMGFEETINDTLRKDARIAFLKKIAPFLYRKKLTLSLPVRVPATTPFPKGRYGSLLKETMSRDIKINLNIFPHETASKVNPEDIIKEFRFFLKTFTFVYEPQTGNTLVEKLISPWLQELQKINYKGPVVFRPRVPNLDNLLTSVKSLAQFLNFD